MQELIDKVQEIVTFELERANTIHPPKFNSMHEAYAVILEEYEEAENEWEKLGVIIGIAWCDIKMDTRSEVWLKRAEKIAIHLAAEAIQVSAMCRKARM